MKSEIRSMTSEDYPPVLQLWKTCEITIEQEDNPESISTFLSAAYSTGFIALVDNVITGAILCATDLRYGYIHHCAVHPDFRRTGIGSRLVHHAREFISSFPGVKSIAVFVWNSNTAGQAFWKQNGFTVLDDLAVLAHTFN